MLLANFLLNPTLTVAAASGTVWMHLRFAYSSVGHAIALTVPAACTAVVLAKDGVYLVTGTRQTNIFKFAAGNRCDIALSCDVGVQTFRNSPNAAAGDEQFPTAAVALHVD